MARTPQATNSRDGVKRVSVKVDFRFDFNAAVHVIQWHIDDHVRRGEPLEIFENKSGTELRKVVSEDLWLHGTIAFERDNDDEEDYYYDLAVELAHRAYPGLGD